MIFTAHLSVGPLLPPTGCCIWAAHLIISTQAINTNHISAPEHNDAKQRQYDSLGTPQQCLVSAWTTISPRVLAMHVRPEMPEAQYFMTITPRKHSRKHTDRHGQHQQRNHNIFWLIISHKISNSYPSLSRQVHHNVAEKFTGECKVKNVCAKQHVTPGHAQQMQRFISLHNHQM